MRTGIENWLLGHWYSPQLPPWYLRIFEPLYRSAFKRARKRQLTRSSETANKLPLIVVGNITAGGSGKTPLVIRLCQLANELGLKPGIASTGYGRQSRQTMQVYSDSNSNDCGDEPVMLAQRTGVPVVVACHRIDAIKALNDLQLDLVISDDGLQHTNLGADIEICVVDGQRGLGNGHLIPAGPLREPLERLQVVDHVVSNGDWNARPDGINVNVMRLIPLTVKSMDNSIATSIDDFLEAYGQFSIHAVAGIGNPQRFFSMLQALGFNVQAHAFADHHRYTKDDFTSMKDGSIILMTEKDAVKCCSLGLENAWYVEVEARLHDEFERILKLEIANLIEDRKT